MSDPDLIMAAVLLVQGMELMILLRSLPSFMFLCTSRPLELWHFCPKIQHSIADKKTYGEALAATAEGIVVFYQKLKGFIEMEGLIGQICNAVETGLFYLEKNGVKLPLFLLSLCVVGYPQTGGNGQGI